MAVMTAPSFWETVRRLASNASEQEAYVSELGTAPSADELALEFNDALTLVADALGSGARAAAQELDIFLANISGRENADVWTVDALYRSLEWKKVRELANELLRYQLDESK